MKKCYALNKPLWVDLYQNDLFCLKKALRLASIYENNGSENLDFAYNDNDNNDDFLKCLALALRLKFFIQTEKYC